MNMCKVSNEMVSISQFEWNITEQGPIFTHMIRDGSGCQEIHFHEFVQKTGEELWVSRLERN